MTTPEIYEWIYTNILIEDRWGEGELDGMIDQLICGGVPR